MSGRLNRISSITALATGSYLLAGRQRQLRWGATELELQQSLPGDDLIAHPDLSATRAITVHAPAARVWPWVAQLGQGRGGFYSYDFLENLLGCDIHSADRIVPEWQTVAAGDEVQLAPEVGLQVALVKKGHALVLRGGIPTGKAAPPYDFTWSFVLSEQPDTTVRLLVRERYSYTRWWSPLLIEPVEVISFLMSRKMLRGIKDRAELAEKTPVPG